MTYSNRIKTLEESYRLVESQIENLEQSDNPDVDKLTKLRDIRNKYLSELRIMRRAQYEDSQSVNFDDDHYH